MEGKMLFILYYIIFFAALQGDEGNFSKKENKNFSEKGVDKP